MLHVNCMQLIMFFLQCGVQVPGVRGPGHRGNIPACRL
ncbi:putative signal peptide protein [Puccinia sorghi]|uniref:Putative signal peptide protein n=1 Tax=Puccinia sorghi TaxID=27349 RepID=A0A0L6VP71_9BASI|nr:putative signal peptide protein [Puccinia sorghi]